MSSGVRKFRNFMTGAVLVNVLVLALVWTIIGVWVVFGLFFDEWVIYLFHVNLVLSIALFINTITLTLFKKFTKGVECHDKSQ